MTLETAPGHFLTDGATAQLQATIINSILSKLWESGSLAVSVTFDGLAANLKTVKLLGHCLKVPNIVSRFPHPDVTDFDVCVILDACHMMKIFRNLLCEYQIIQIRQGQMAAFGVIAGETAGRRFDSS
jgi:hypothetical protein